MSAKFENVLMTWDYYDGPRAGIAEYNGKPHYFECIWDEAKDNYSEKFELSPVGNSFLDSAKKQWQIFREWELLFHSGEVTKDTHPGHRGNNPKYDLLEDELEERLKQLSSLPDVFTARFKALPNPNYLPKYFMAEMEVHWTKIR